MSASQIRRWLRADRFEYEPPSDPPVVRAVASVQKKLTDYNFRRITTASDATASDGMKDQKCIGF